MHYIQCTKISSFTVDDFLIFIGDESLEIDSKHEEDGEVAGEVEEDGELATATPPAATDGGRVRSGRPTPPSSHELHSTPRKLGSTPRGRWWT